MPSRIGSKSIEIDTHFEQYFMPGRIGSKSIEIDTQFDQAGIQCNLSEFTPNWSSISCPVEF